MNELKMLMFITNKNLVYVQVHFFENRGQLISYKVKRKHVHITMFLLIDVHTLKV